MFCQLFDGDASVLKYTLITIDVTNAGGVADSIHIPRVVHSEWLSLLILQFTHIFCIHKVAILALFNVNFDFFARPMVKEGQLFPRSAVNGAGGEDKAEVAESLHGIDTNDIIMTSN